MEGLKTILAFLLSLCCSIGVMAKPGVTNLRVELLENPIGIDKVSPRLSWQLQDEARNVKQTTYRVLVASSTEKLAQNEGDLWDSGEQHSDNSIAVFYAGKALKSNTEVFWKVKVTTNTGVSDWSAPAMWQVGLLYYKDWDKRWIGFDRYFQTDDQQKGYLSARYFRKEIALEKQVAKATAYIMGLGLYEFYIDGQKIGDQVLAPGLTDYTQNVKYNTFDVTEQLRQGKHALGVTLGNGRYYAIRHEKPYKIKDFGFPKMQLQIRITYVDGSSQTLYSDNTWKGTTDGPIRSNNEYDGEVYDARKELTGWSSPGFDETAWIPAEYVQEPGRTYQAQINRNMKVMQDIKPVSITAKDGKYIVDFGQNFSGWVKMRVRGAEGTAVTLRFAESLNQDGTLFRDNLRAAKATDTYILKGAGEEVWEPRFTYHGFRYMEVAGYPGKAELADFVGRFVYDEMETVGHFKSSNALLNQIHQNAWWGIASNYKSIPVDCPQRNERQGWLGDRPTSAYGENFLFDNANFYIKWLEDIRLAQTEDGAIPDVAPTFWRYYSDNMTWPSAYPMIADMLFQQTGDVRTLKEHYPAMKKWMHYMRARYMDDKGIITKDSYGDWCEPPVTIEAGRGKSADKKYPNPVLSTAYYYYLLQVMARFSEYTDNAQDKDVFLQRAARMKQDFNRAFQLPDGGYGKNTLTENLLAMYFGLAEESDKQKLADRIVEIIEVENKGHLSTGVVGTQWIMRTLTDIGRSDLAYKLATNTTYPSWGYMIEHGATTIWELWNGNTAHPQMNSENHVMMLGDLLIWSYENLAGIKSKENGFQTIVMKPEMIAGLHEVEASYRSLYGEISSTWKRDNKTYTWTVSIPTNTQAEIYLPAKAASAVTVDGVQIKENQYTRILSAEAGKVKAMIGSGTYTFNIKL